MEVLRRCPGPRHCTATSALRNCCFSCRAGQSHNWGHVRCTTVEEQLEAKEVQLSQLSSTSLLMISSGLTPPPSSWSLDLAWNPVEHTQPLCFLSWCFTSTEPTRLICLMMMMNWCLMVMHITSCVPKHGEPTQKALRTDSPGRPPRLSHS